MTIEFRCVNPECQKLLSGPDDWPGREIHCPACGTPQAVPAAQEPAPIEMANEPPAPAAEGVVCPECRQMVAAGAASCPACGTVLYLPDAVTPPPTIHRAGADETPQDYNVLVECLRSAPYAFSNWSSIFKLVGFFVLIYLAFYFGSPFLLLWIVGPMAVKLLAMLIVLSFWVTVGGYFLRFYVDCALGGLERLEQAPNIPDFNPRELFMTGLRGLAMTVVFVLPVVTIPLLPLGYLSLAYNNDHRAFNPLRAFHAATKCPGALAGLWLVIICLFLLTIGLVFLVFLVMGVLATTALAGGGCFTAMLLVLLTGLLLAFIMVTFSCMCFYCFGILGRHRPATLEVLSKPGTAGVSAACVCGGVVVSIVVMIQLGAWLKPSAEAARAERQPVDDTPSWQAPPVRGPRPGPKYPRIRTRPSGRPRPPTRIR